ncbi:RNB domain-containing ribonuclease [Cyanobium sp. Morenito 9A2]|nr:RNB domain-containing ribonuclease [Cyanobium sp. Morenito 9A2]MCP9850574.1 RNB domain-containing ribonuclease [Cyanobium sp. Morenito 9A2]
MPIGDLVGLFDRQAPTLGLIAAVQGSRAAVLVGFGAKSQLLPLRQLDLIQALPRGHEPVSRLEVAPWGLTEAALAAARPRRRDWGAAWLLLDGDGEFLPFAEFVGLVAGSSTPVAASACWLELQRPGQDLFRWRQGQVQARPRQDLHALRHGRRHQRLLIQHQQQWHDALRQRRPIDPAQLSPVSRQELGQLLAWAAGEQDQPLGPELLKGLQQARVAPEPGALRHLLVDLGQWQAHSLPSLRQSVWSAGFSPELIAQADALVERCGEPQPGDGQRFDLTGLRSFTIDDPLTREIDDALSLERLAAGRQRLWVHIADPARLVAEGSPLDLEARRRASSLYLAGGSVPMFPLELAAGPFSLRQGERCAAWSYGIDLHDDGSLAGYELRRSWVRPTYRLSYEDADDLIELAPPEDPDLSELHLLLESRRRWRERQGALLLDQSEGRIRCEDDEPLVEVVEPSPARLLVAEAMIMAGAAVADYGVCHGLALPYRSQSPSPLPPAEQWEHLAPGPVRHATLRRGLTRGLTGTQPAPHFSLGLPAYVQATSPIRRYGDLVVQRQLLAHQAGDIPLEASALAGLLDQLDPALRQTIQIAREDQRHWQQVWFERHLDGSWPALFLRWLRQQDGLALVHLDALAMDLPALAPEGCEPGDGLVVRVGEVDCLADRLRLLAVRSTGQP